MRTRTIIGIATVIAVAATSASAFAQGRGGGGNGRDADRADAQQRAQVERAQRELDRDRLSEPERERIHDRDQDRTKAPETAPHNGDRIYGGELMSAEERNQYREQLRLTESDPKARTEFLAQHREKMQIRAKKLGRELGDPPDEN